MMIKFTVDIPRPKRRARELYDADSPFKQKVVETKKRYERKRKHRERYEDAD
jgi:hypothetical protein